MSSCQATTMATIGQGTAKTTVSCIRRWWIKWCYTANPISDFSLLFNKLFQKKKLSANSPQIIGFGWNWISCREHRRTIEIPRLSMAVILHWFPTTSPMRFSSLEYRNEIRKVMSYNWNLPGLNQLKGLRGRQSIAHLKETYGDSTSVVGIVKL